MVSLGDVEPEIASLILEFVDDSSPRSTKAVACVSKYFNALTKLTAHRHKVILIKGSIDDKVVEILERWCNNDTVLANIRTLAVKGWIENDWSFIEDDSFVDDDDDDDHDEDDEEAGEGGENDEGEGEGEGTGEEDDLDSAANPGTPDTPPKVDPEEVWNPLVTLLSRIGKLQLLDWNIKHPIPVSILDAFETHQKASRLRIWNFVRATASASEPDVVESRLAKSPALTHIRHVGDEFRAWPDYQETAFRTILGSAPKLQYAGLLRRHGDIPLDETEHAEFERTKGNFKINQKPNSSIRHLTLDGVEISKATLDDWASTVDLSTLHSVKFSRGIPTLDYFKCAATMLPNLKHIRLNLRPVRDQSDSPERRELVVAIKEYIATCAPLRTLSLWSWIGIVPLSDILERHGATLSTLQLHERETSSTEIRDVISLDEVKSIRNSCPNLKDFTFDLNRSSAKLLWDSDENKKYYDELAKCEHLETLQIYFDAGMAHLYSITISDPYGSRPFSLTDDSDAEDSDDDNDGPINQATSTTATIQAVTSTSTNTTANGTSQSPSSSPSSDPPASKRRRIAIGVRPSRDTYVASYVRQIWTTVFGNKAGARHLDVKIGEWEGASSVGFVEMNLRRHFMVRPHERDDMRTPVVRVDQKRGGGGDVAVRST